MAPVAMHLPAFETEAFFSEYEFTAPWMLAASDCEPLSVRQLLELTDTPPDLLLDTHLGYTESTGHPDLRKAIAKLYESVSPEHVVVLGSPVEGIFVAMQSLLDDTSEAIAIRPAYDALTHVAAGISKCLRHWDLEPDDDGWRLDLGQLADSLTPETRLLIVNFPHNPTGYLPTPDEWSDLIELCRRRSITLFCDEIYRGLEWGTPIASAADAIDDAVVLGGLSKAHGLPGLRAGWLIVRDPELRARIVNWKHYTTICPAAPTETLARVAIEHADVLLRRARGIVQRNLPIAEQFFARRANRFTWRAPRAGSTALVELDLAALGVPSAEAWCHQLARRDGIVLLPGTCLGTRPNFVRLGLGRQNFPACLERLATALSRSR